MTLLPERLRIIFTQFRLGNGKLPIKTGRWFYCLDRNERYCTLCNRNEIGDEFRLLFQCDTLRSQINNESVYREEVQRMVGWCKNNNLVLNISKTKEMIIDFRKKKTPIHPLFIDGAEVLQPKFLGSTISKDLSWCNNSIDIIKKAQKRMSFLRHLKRFGLSQAILTRFYRAVIESVLPFSITVWFGRASQDEINQTEPVVKNASKLIGLNMPSIRSLYRSRSLRKSKRIV